MCLATNRASGTVRSNRNASSPGVPPLLVTSKICRSTSSEPAPLPVKTSIRSMWGVSIGTKPKLAKVCRKTASIRSRGIITAGGRSLSPLATRGSIMVGLSPGHCAGLTCDALSGQGDGNSATSKTARRVCTSEDSTILAGCSDGKISTSSNRHAQERFTVVPAKDFKRRMVVEIDGAPHMIEQIQVQTPSARGAATLYKIKARNLKTKARVEKSYRGTDSLNESSFERRPVQYLYRDPDALHFMDSVTFNQFSFSLDELRDQASFMTENMEGVEALVVDDEVIAIELPDTVELPIVETTPGVRGNSATGRTKPATLSTGFVVQVPEHLDQGAIVRVDTRTGEYLGRAG